MLSIMVLPVHSILTQFLYQPRLLFCLLLLPSYTITVQLLVKALASLSKAFRQHVSSCTMSVLP